MRDAAGGGDVPAERCSAVHSAHQACGRCPPENHLGDAESRQLQNAVEQELIATK
jgi:hypothetical protein